MVDKEYHNCFQCSNCQWPSLMRQRWYFWMKSQCQCQEKLSSRNAIEGQATSLWLCCKLTLFVIRVNPSSDFFDPISNWMFLNNRNMTVQVDPLCPSTLFFDFPSTIIAQLPWLIASAYIQRFSNNFSASSISVLIRANI